MFGGTKCSNDARAFSGEETIMKAEFTFPFPWKLYEMLDYAVEQGFEDVVSWRSHGRAFRVHKPKEFAECIMPRFFSQTKYASFQRQLNLYAFSRITNGKDKGAYYHSSFIRGDPKTARAMSRQKTKGKKTLFERMLTVAYEPDFYNNGADSENRPAEQVENEDPSEKPKKIVQDEEPSVKNEKEPETTIMDEEAHDGLETIHVSATNKSMYEPVEPSIFDDVARDAELDADMLDPIPLTLDDKLLEMCDDLLEQSYWSDCNIYNENLCECFDENENVFSKLKEL